MAAHVLYRFYSATGQLLYVGITMNPSQRFSAHRSTKYWWDGVAGITLEHYGDREELAAAERRAIEVEHPLHNIIRAKLPTNPIPPEPEPEPEPDYEYEYEYEAENATDPASWPATSVFASLFNHSQHERERKKELEEKLSAAYQAKWAAINECPLCDDEGRRNMYLCNHSLRTGYLQDAQRRVQRERLEIVKDCL